MEVGLGEFSGINALGDLVGLVEVSSGRGGIAPDELIEPRR